jgi:Flp pilus assembly protein TadG
MALVLPLLLLLLFGVVEFGRFLSSQHGVSTAAREAARYGFAIGPSPNGVPQYSDCDAIADAARGLSGLGQVTAADVGVRYIDSGGSEIIACPATASAIQAAVVDGDRVEVTVTRPFTPIVPFVSAGFPGTITATDSRTIFLMTP